MVQKIGVRELVGFILRSGDLNSSLSSFNTPQAGTRIHKQLQRHRGSDYQAEVALKTEVELNGRPVLIHGRADGITTHDGQVEIEEIKTSDAEWGNLPTNQLTLYWGQVKLYAALLMRADPDVSSVALTLTYVQTPDELIMREHQSISRTQALDFFTQVTAEYESWLALKEQLALDRVQTAAQVSFPFPSYRKGQRELAAAVYKSAVLGKHLLLEAPTGTGKTISTLFPAVKAFATDQVERLFYLTAKQSTRRVAEEALELLRQHGLRIQSITLTAKEQIQFPEEADLEPEQNPYFQGYYDRLKPALKAILSERQHLTKAVVQDYARRYQLDPFEFSLDVSLFCDVIVCDYNYLFDPVVKLQRFFTVENQQNFLLVDEAHNLVDRAREMYSTELTQTDCATLLQSLPRNQANRALRRRLQELLQQFERLQTELPTGKTTAERAKPDEVFTMAVTKSLDSLRRWLAKHPTDPLVETVQQFFLTVTTYLKINDLFGDNFRWRIIMTEETVTVRIFCLDASPFIKAQLELARGSVLFSATLSPLTYYQRVLGDNPKELKYQLPSPFNSNSQTILIATYINTTYNQRTNSLASIVASIHKLVTSKQGNYLVFAPSYAYLDQIYQAYRKQYPHQLVQKQHPNMDANARDQFLAAFQQPETHPIVGFALLGGIFSEGIDLVGDRLIGVAIVGVGLPGLNTETNLIRDYFEQHNGRGFEFAYQLPGLNHVFQAAGRVIRTIHDRGVILLLDRRFAEPRYRQWFPASWQQAQIVHNPAELTRQLQTFWQSQTDL
ncbi:PD-(D/E)XK nuclease family protein [Fructilactobacillus hinvesii]|uniref:PD-(D/E)XK nuclease family protein n=1 Tax=Fructilactobacillus hinvesii TaxID=2940300 RepID=A0ABY5BTA8_9LACO|nr:helicase C-terminal domain-containing protein [Fructilactobacillus hinvesii]USS88360.1 PD-(D/E)XK nuclease family protein [Fructilactobacillus hinvesii]